MKHFFSLLGWTAAFLIGIGVAAIVVIGAAFCVVGGCIVLYAISGGAF